MKNRYISPVFHSRCAKTCLQPLFGALSTIMQSKVRSNWSLGVLLGKLGQNGKNPKKWKIDLFRLLLAQGAWKCAYNHYLGRWARLCSQKYAQIGPLGSYWENLGKMAKIRKNGKSTFFDFCTPKVPESGPITIIWGAEHDYAVKSTLRLVLWGPTGKTWAKWQKSEKLKNRPFST